MVYVARDNMIASSNNSNNHFDSFLYVGWILRGHLVFGELSNLKLLKFEFEKYLPKIRKCIFQNFIQKMQIFWLTTLEDTT